MPDDVLIAAGKKTAPIVATSVAVVSTATTAVPSSVAVAPAKVKEAAPVLEGVVAMDGMQKAVAKNMEKTLSTPIFRVSR